MKFRRFLGEFLKAPGSIGAIAPSSPQLADSITEAAGVRQARVIVELGPGTGALTAAILRKRQPGSTYIAIEANASFVEEMKQRFPGVLVHHDSAVAIRRYVEAAGHSHCDCIVSGLPFATFPDTLQDELLAAIHEALDTGGRFTTFAYLQGLLVRQGRRFQQRLRAKFPQVARTPTVWRNMPPAFVYRAVK
jgi:phospholipid N-methyltransferase